MDTKSYVKTYPGSEGFSEFLEKYVIKVNVPKEQIKLYLINNKDLYKRYSSFCKQKHIPVATKNNIGKHLSFLGVKIDTKLGPRENRKCCYSGVKWVDGTGITYEKKAVRKKLEAEGKIIQKFLPISNQNQIPVSIPIQYLWIGHEIKCFRSK